MSEETGAPDTGLRESVAYYSQALIFACASIAFYRGAWMLMDKYLFPGNMLLSALASVLIGFLFFVLFNNPLI